MEAEFFVLEEKGKSLLSKTTAIELGILRLGPEEPGRITHSVRVEDLNELYPKLFSGLGQLKHVQLEIPVDNVVTPVVQATRRIPYQLRDNSRRNFRIYKMQTSSSQLKDPANGYLL